jgi:hypothetical protein
VKFVMDRGLKEACWLKELVRGWSNVMYETPALASIFKKGPASFLVFARTGTIEQPRFSLPLGGNHCAMPECIPFIQPASNSLCWHFARIHCQNVTLKSLMP